MREFVLFSFLSLLLLSLDHFAASLLIRGRSNIEKPTDRENLVPHVCLEPPGDLPACDFDDGSTDRSLGKPLQPLNSPVSNTLVEPEEPEAIANAEVTGRATTIIYRIEGCIPHRLPFVLPLCEKQASHRRNVEIIRLFPSEPIGPLAQDSEGLAPLIFSRVHANQWQRFAQESRIHPTDLVSDRARDTDSDTTGSSPMTRIVDVSKNHGEIGRHVAEKTSSTEQFQRFPYAEALPSNAEELRVSKSGDRFSRTEHLFSHPPMILNDTSRVNGDNFGIPWPLSHSRAISLDTAKLGPYGSSIQRNYKSPSAIPEFSRNSLHLEEIRSRGEKSKREITRKSMNYL